MQQRTAFTSRPQKRPATVLLTQHSTATVVPASALIPPVKRTPLASNVKKASATKKKASDSSPFTLAKAKEERPVQLYSREVMEPATLRNSAVVAMTTDLEKKSSSSAAGPQEIFARSPFACARFVSRRCVGISRRICCSSRPTVVQERAIAHIVARRDIVLKGRTGLGKTLAFLLPIIDMLQQSAAGCRASSTAPTPSSSRPPRSSPDSSTRRRGAWHAQAFNWIVPGVLSGGRKKDSEKKALRKGLPIVISTPGRLLDHLRTTKAFRLARIQFLVLDEADRLLDAGFRAGSLAHCRAAPRTRRGARRHSDDHDLGHLVCSPTATSAVRVARMRDPLYIDADLEEQKPRKRNRSDFQCKPAEPPVVSAKPMPRLSKRK
jgi:hypothetical protein